MRKLITIALLFISGITCAQSWVNTGNALQQQTGGSYKNWRFNLGTTLGFLPFYSKTQTDSAITFSGSLTNYYTKTQSDSRFEKITSLGWATPQQYGADSTGVADATAAFRACLAANLNVRLNGKYKLSDSVSLRSNQQIYSDNAQITFTGVNKNLFAMNGLYNAAIKGKLLITGTGNTPGTSAAIHIAGGNSNQVNGITFTNMSGYGVLITASNVNVTRGNETFFNDNFFVNNYIGVQINPRIDSPDTRGTEYFTFANNNFRGNTYPVISYAGNQNWNGGNIVDNTHGIFVDGSGVNAAHDTWTGVNINHNGNYAAYLLNISSGEIFTGCRFYKADSGTVALKIVNSTGLAITSGTIDGDINIDANSYLSLANVLHGASYSIPAHSDRVFELMGYKVDGTPVSSTLNGDLHAANAYQNGNQVANDNAVVHNTGNETIAGSKSFTDQLNVHSAIGMDGQAFVTSSSIAGTRYYYPRTSGNDVGHQLTYHSDGSGLLTYGKYYNFGTEPANNGIFRVLGTLQNYNQPINPYDAVNRRSLDSLKMLDSTNMATLYVKKAGDTMNGALSIKDSAIIYHSGLVPNAISAAMANSLQGLAIDSNYLYVSSTTAFYKRDKITLAIIDSNKTPFAGITTVDHMGDGQIDPNTGYLNIILSNSLGCGASSTNKIAVYDVSSSGMPLIAQYNITSFDTDMASAVATDGANMWLSDYCTGAHIYKLDMSGNLVATITPDYNILYIQGMKYRAGLLWVSNTSGYLYTIDPATGHVSLINSPASPANDSNLEYEGIAWNTAGTDLLWLVVDKSVTPSMGYIHTYSGSASFSLFKVGALANGKIEGGFQTGLPISVNTANKTAAFNANVQDNEVINASFTNAVPRFRWLLNTTTGPTFNRSLNAGGYYRDDQSQYSFYTQYNGSTGSVAFRISAPQAQSLISNDAFPFTVTPTGANTLTLLPFANITSDIGSTSLAYNNIYTAKILSPVSSSLRFQTQSSSNAIAFNFGGTDRFAATSTEIRPAANGVGDLGASGMIFNTTRTQNLQVNLTGLLKGNGVGNNITAISGTSSQFVMGDGSLLSGLPSGTTATTQSQGDNSTKVATTAYVDRPLVNNVLSKSADYTVVADDFAAGKSAVLDLYVDCTSGPVTITLPTGLSGYTIYLTKTDASANTITISGGGTVYGSNSITAQYQSRQFNSNGSGWYNH